MRVDCLSNIIDMDISVANLTRSVRNAEETAECPTNDVIIIVSDDDEDDVSNSSSYDIHNQHDDASNDADCQSSISTYSTYTLNEVHNIETLSLDSSHHLPQCSDSQDSIEAVHLVTVKNTEANCHSAADHSEPTNDSSENIVDELLSESVAQIPPISDSTFEKLVDNFNGTEVSESFLAKASTETTESGEPASELVIEENAEATVSPEIQETEEHIDEPNDDNNELPPDGASQEELNCDISAQPSPQPEPVAGPSRTASNRVFNSRKDCETQTVSPPLEGSARGTEYGRKGFGGNDLAAAIAMGSDDDSSIDGMYSSVRPFWMRNGCDNQDPPKTYSKQRGDEQIGIGKSLDDLEFPLIENPSLMEDDALLTQYMASRLNEFKIRHLKSFDLLPTFVAMQQKALPRRRQRTLPPKITDVPAAAVAAPVRRRRPLKKTAHYVPEEVIRRRPTKRGRKRKPKLSEGSSPTQTTPVRRRRPGAGRKKVIDIEKIESLPPTILTRQTYTKSANFMEIPEGGDCLIEGLIKTRNMKCYPAMKKKANGLSTTILERKSYVKSTASTHSNSSSTATSNQPLDTHIRNALSLSVGRQSIHQSIAAAKPKAFAPNYKKKNAFDDECVSSKGIRNPIFSLQASGSAAEAKRAKVPSEHSSEFSSDYEDSDGTIESKRKLRRSRKQKRKFDL